MTAKSLFTVFAFASLVMGASSLQAKTLIVSDVDDTVKMTDVLGSKPTVVINGLFKEKAFAGMSELYNEMAKIEETDVYYVSGSPKMIRFRVDEFLEENQFPQRKNLILKDKMSDDTYEYKTTEIKKLIAQLNPDKVILIGDDTEYDPEVYKNIQEAHPNLVEAVYIRSVKGRDDVQTSFFSPVEIAAHEFVDGRLGKEAIGSSLQGFVKQTHDSGIALKKRYCPKEGRAQLEELKAKVADAEIVSLLDKAQSKIIKSCK